MRGFIFSFLLGLMAHSSADTVIVIDPGHGGDKDSGSQKERSLSASNNAVSPSKLLEKDLTLELSLEIVNQLKGLAKNYPGKTIRPVLTRTDDGNPDFIERAEICAKATPAAIFSLHFNASENHSQKGTVAVVENRKSNPNFAVDQIFAKGLVAATHTGVAKFVPGSKRLEPITDSHLHGGMGSNFFYQLALHPKLKSVPKCFLEVEFIDRADIDAALLQRRRESFPVIARHITEYLYSRAE